MSPAGSGSGEFRGGLRARAARRSMCALVLPWLLPVGLFGTVALISLPSPFGYLVAGIWGWVAFPSVVAYIRGHSLAGGGRNSRSGSEDDQADYWRTRLM